MMSITDSNDAPQVATVRDVDIRGPKKAGRNYLTGGKQHENEPPSYHSAGTADVGLYVNNQGCHSFRDDSDP